MKENRLLLVFFMVGILTHCYAQEWIDVTDTYVINPRFDGNDRYTGWQGDGYGAYNPVENAEHYERNFNSYQVLKGLPAGKYRVSLNAFYRMGSAENDYNLYTSGDFSAKQYAKLYATSSVNDYEVAILPSSSAALTQSLGGQTSTVGSGNWGWWGGGTSYYIPNNMEAAYYWFEAGHYLNTLECEVGEDGELIIGVRKFVTVGGDWTCLDNWKLEYYGTPVYATGVEINGASTEMTVFQEAVISAKVFPEDATYQKVTWKSSNPSVISVVNGVLYANAEGKAVITATSFDGKASTSIEIAVSPAGIASASTVIINEIMAANVDVYRDPSTNYGSWVELYNPSNKGVKIGGLYITDDPNNLRKNKLLDGYGVLPAKGYIILNFDHHEVWTQKSYRQIDDKLDCDGGTIIISDGNTIIAQQEYPEAISRVSYARTIDGGSTWGMTATPSPGSSNEVAGGFAEIRMDAPVVSRDGGLFSGSLNISVTIPSGATLKYTTDGTAPSYTNGEVSETGNFSVTSTQCYRFRLFKDGYLPSKVVTRSFIENNGNEPFPIISLVMNKDDWDGATNGIFSYSSMGRPGNGQTSKYNANMDWDRPVNFEYITTDNEYALSQECDIATCGGWSRAWTPHSFKLKAAKTYELQNTFDYQFFDEKPFLKHKTLQIRNGGNDNGCRIKDPAIQQVVATSGLNVDYQSWQPVHVYVNGSSYAVLNMREPNNKHFAYANRGIDTDEMDQFEMSPDSGYVQMEGTEEAFMRWYDLSVNASDESTYEEICKLVDIDEYINYMVVELYVGNWDWPQNNVKGYRDVNDGKFRFVLFDMDGSLSTDTPLNTFFDKEWYTFDTLHGFDYSNGENVEGKHIYQEIKFVTIFKNMLKNEKFKKQFVDAFCIAAGSVFEAGRVRNVVSEMSSYLSSGGYVNPSDTANDVMNRLSSGRQSSMVSHVQSYLGIKNPKQKVTLSSSVDGGQLLVNGLEVPTGKFSGSLFGPVTYKAIAPAGYTFVGWSGNGTVEGEKVNVFDRGSSWNYADSDMSSTRWKSDSSAFSASGYAPIGYGKNDIKTKVTSNRLAYYFGRNFELDTTPTSADKFTLNFTIDDGCVVYVNGKEAGKYNMPSGNVNDNTAATTYANNNPDSGTMELEASLFKKGTNYIAVSVHNNQTSSSDIYWDAALVHTLPARAGGDAYLSTEVEITIEDAGTYNLVACYEPIDESKLIANGVTPVKVNEVSAANTMAVNDYFKKDDWIELYNTTSEPVDVAGMYLSDNESKPQKYQIPLGSANTVIEPHGHLVVWASKRDPKSQLHASFKLDNADDAKVILTNQDGSWSDVLTYKAHDGKESVGLYPDGGLTTYKMDVPSINATNTISTQSLYVSTYTPTIPDPEPEPDPEPDPTYTITLTEGWNWMSHPFASEQSISPFIPYADDFMNATKRHYHNGTSWAGDDMLFDAVSMTKVHMVSDFSKEYQDKYYNIEGIITLNEGWNWLGYPLIKNQKVEVALANLTPSEGDVIVGQDEFAVYEDGKWAGTLEVLTTGEGYMYKAKNRRTFQFNDATSSAKSHAKAPFHVQPPTEWTASMTEYPDVMNFVAEVKYNDEVASGEFSIGAFDENGVCRGIGKYIDDFLYLTVNGTKDMKITLAAFNGETEHEVDGHFTFTADVFGSHKTPVILNIGVPVDIPSVDRSSIVESEYYYTADGILVGNAHSALRPGIYIAKYLLIDGKTISKKIIIK